jgi:hypothetical protein
MNGRCAWRRIVAMSSMPPNAQAHFAKQKMTRAAESVSAIADALAKESAESEQAYERFYNNLALFSGGTVALSVTYLGYLKSLGPIAHKCWLAASWVALISCVACSLFWVLFHAHYGHYARNRELTEAQRKQYQIEADEIQHIGPIENLRTAASLSPSARHAARQHQFWSKNRNITDAARKCIRACGNGADD